MRRSTCMTIAPAVTWNRWVEPALVVLALVTYGMSWHVVHQTTAMDLSPLFCAMSPDCRPPPPEPVHDTGVVTSCTGFTHDRHAFEIVGILALALLVLDAAFRERRTWTIVGLLVGSTLLSAVAFFQAIGPLLHMFDRVEILLPAYLHVGAFLAIGIATSIRVGARIRATRSRSAKAC